MWKMLYFVTVVGVFLLAVNGQKWDIKKLEQCPCADNIIETFLASVAKSALEDVNGQKLRLRLWQLNNDDCTAKVLDESPKPGKIEISMVYRGSLHTEEQDKGEDVEDQYKSDDEAEQQETVDDEGQDRNDDIQIQHGSAAPGYQQGVDIEQEQGGGDIGQEQAAEVIGLLRVVNTALEQFQQNIGQEQGGVDIGQEQSELSKESGGEKDYSAEFSFTVDVNTGKLSDSTESMKGTRRRKREVMPFETVIIKIAINFDQKPDSDVGTTNEQIKAMLRKGLNDYWLAMAFCILDVEQ